MAIPSTKLSNFIGSSRSPGEILRRLRESALLSESAPDAKIIRLIQEAIAEEDDWASADTTIPGLLFDAGYLSPEGLEWSTPDLIKGPQERKKFIEAHVPGRREHGLWIRAEDTVAVVAMLDQGTKRLRALRELQRRGAEAVSAVPRLVALLREPDQAVVWATLETLRTIGTAARDALPVLAELASDADPLIRMKARATLQTVCQESGN